MTKVITELELKEYSGMNQAVFAAGTIITPSARDWAKEHQLQIVVEGIRGEKLQNSGNVSKIDRNSLLKQVIKSMKAQLEKNGAPVKKDELFKAVLICLERLGFQIKDF